jgi:hypothetical protein
MYPRAVGQIWYYKDLGHLYEIMSLEGPGMWNIKNTKTAIPYPDSGFEDEGYSWEIRYVEPAVGQTWKVGHGATYGNPLFTAGRLFTIRDITALYYSGQWLDGKEECDFDILNFAANCVFVPGDYTPAVKQDTSRYPHTCPRCGAPAYVGGGPTDVDCTSTSCPTRKKA